MNEQNQPGQEGRQVAKSAHLLLEKLRQKREKPESNIQTLHIAHKQHHYQ